MAEKVVRICEKVHTRLTVTLDWEPKSRTEVVLSDEEDFPKGSATFYPFNQMNLFVIPTDKLSFLSDADQYLNVLIIHEYTHILHIDKHAGKVSVLRSIFGRNVLLFPNNFQPVWFVEGLATFYETDHEKGIGRGENNWFHMKMRMEVAKGVMSIRQTNIAPLSPPYLYGEHFFEFLTDTYGPEKISALIKTFSNNLIPYSINSNAREVLGKDLAALWNEFETYLIDRYQPELEVIRNQGIVEGTRVADTEGRYVSIKGYFDGGVRAMPDGSLYYVKSFDQRRQALMLRKPDGASEEITELRSSARFDVHPEAGVIIAQPEICGEYRVYFDLYKKGPGDRNLRRLTKGSRYRWVAWSPYGSQMVAVKTSLAKSELHLLDAEGQFLEKLWEGNEGELVSQLDWSPDGSRIVAAASFQGTGWNIWEFDIKKKRWQALTRDRDIEMYPQYSSSGNSILFCSDHGGVFNIRKIDLESHQIATLTHVEGGAFQPTQGSEDGDIFYLRYGKNGFNIYQLSVSQVSASQDELTTPGEKPLTESIQALETKDDHVAYEIYPYRPWPAILPHSWIPFAELTEDIKNAGIVIFGKDALNIYRYSLALAYDMDNKDPVGSVAAGYQRLNLYASRSNKAYQYDSGDHRIRQKDIYQATVYFPWTTLDFAWKIHFGLSSEIDEDNDIRSDHVPWTDTRDNLYGGAITFDNSKYFLYSISRNRGRKVRLVVESSDFWNSDYTGEIYTIDWREYLPLFGKHVLALRLVQGWGNKHPYPFELGGERSTDINNLIFFSVGESLFHYREYPLRGYPDGLSQLIGRRMQLGSLEWRFPIVEIKRGLMVPPVGLHQLAGVLFVETGSAWNSGGTPDEYYTGSGVELVADISVVYQLNIRTRLGYGHGFDDIGEDRVYVSLGAAF